MRGEMSTEAWVEQQSLNETEGQRSIFLVGESKTSD